MLKKQTTEKKIDILHPELLNRLDDLHWIHQEAMLCKGTKYFYSIAEKYGLDKIELIIILGIPYESVRKFDSVKKTIKGAPAEHLIRLELLHQLGLKIFRTSAEFNKWLSLPFKETNKVASEYLKTNSGITLLTHELQSIGFGFPV